MKSANPYFYHYMSMFMSIALLLYASFEPFSEDNSLCIVDLFDTLSKLCLAVPFLQKISSWISHSTFWICQLHFCQQGFYLVRAGIIISIQFRLYQIFQQALAR